MEIEVSYYRRTFQREIMYLLEMAREFEKKPNRRLLAESSCHSVL